MLSLRVALILLSVAVVVGLYAWSRRRSRRRSMGRLVIEPERRHRGSSRLPLDPPASGGEEGGGEDPLQILVQPPDVEDEGPRVVNPEARRRKGRRGRGGDRGQLELGFDEPMDIDETLEEQEGQEPAPGRGRAAGQARVIVLYVEVAEPRRLAGPELVDALREVDLEHGEMRIFHHFGVGRMRSEQALFSVANMFEPGEFDLSKLPALSTRGVAMFMRLPAPLDGPVVFELMLSTAQRLAQRLDAQVCDEGHRPLSAETIEEIRDAVARYGQEAI